jgi:hypothetical protein
MKLAAAGVRFVLVVALAIAGASALIGLIVVRAAGLGGAAQGAGWGMCIGGAMVALVVGQSGSPSRMAGEGRWSNYTPGGAAAQLWGRNPALPQSPLWAAASAVLVFAGGIAVIVLTY